MIRRAIGGARVGRVSPESRNTRTGESRRSSVTVSDNNPGLIRRILCMFGIHRFKYPGGRCEFCPKIQGK
jgi:hypothetical protein